MTLISMQVACGCSLDAKNETGHVSACDNVEAWDGPTMNGFVEGRRYLWRCATCNNTICVNLTLPEVPE